MADPAHNATTSTPPPSRRITGASVEPLLWSQSPFSPEGLKRLTRNKQFCISLLSSLQKQKLAKDLAAAELLVSRPRDSCSSTCGGKILKDHELLLAIRLLWLLDGAEWVEELTTGEFPDQYYELVECLHCLHNR